MSTEYLKVRYKNYRGEERTRSLSPLGVFYGKTQWHPEDQWLLRVIDAEDGKTKFFALRDCNFLTPEDASDAAKERDKLAAWKAEAMACWPPVKEIAKALKLPLGVSIHDKILPAVIEMRAVIDCLDILRAEEGDGVSLMSDRADFPGENCAIDCIGDWTGWREERFEGNTVLSCLRAAVAARQARPQPYPVPSATEFGMKEYLFQFMSRLPKNRRAEFVREIQLEDTRLLETQP